MSYYSSNLDVREMIRWWFFSFLVRAAIIPRFRFVFVGKDLVPLSWNTRIHAWFSEPVLCAFLFPTLEFVSLKSTD